MHSPERILNVLSFATTTLVYLRLGGKGILFIEPLNWDRFIRFYSVEALTVMDWPKKKIVVTKAPRMWCLRKSTPYLESINL